MSVEYASFLCIPFILFVSNISERVHEQLSLLSSYMPCPDIVTPPHRMASTPTNPHTCYPSLGRTSYRVPKDIGLGPSLSRRDRPANMIRSSVTRLDRQ
jgi:hypothetical protein